MGVIKGFFGFDVFKEQPNFSLENFHDICWGVKFWSRAFGGFINWKPYWLGIFRVLILALMHLIVPIT